MGELYNLMGEFEKALEYFEKSLKIREPICGAQSEEVAIIQKNMGNCFEFMGKKDEALAKYNLALGICKKSVGENHLTTASIYENISKIYYAKGIFDEAKVNAEKAFEIRRELLPRKHYLTAMSLIDLGMANYMLGEYDEALHNFTFSLETNLQDYTPAGINYYKIPEIRNYQDINTILNAFKGKAMVFITMYIKEKASKTERKESADYALKHIKACDETIDLIRKSSIDEKDKLQVSANSVAVYDMAIQFCYILFLDSNDQKYLELAFYYSEKLKAGTLLEALAGSEAQKFANIPDSVIYIEKQLDRQIADLRKQLAETGNYNIEDDLFKLETEKQNLIKHCETTYPKYFQLKYSSSFPDVKTIQASLDEKTALVSYYQTEKSVFQIVLTNKSVNFSSKDKFENFDQKMDDLRYAIIHGDAKNNIEKYKILANEFYSLLFQQYIDKQIKNLVIIPAGNLASIPFEALLTAKPAEKQKFKDLPYLIEKYNISYAYSANLYYITSKKQKQDQIEITKLNDWLAFAPVFSDETTSGMSIRSLSLLRQINESIDTLKTRGVLLSGNYVSPLPGTEKEVKNIFDAFNNQNKNAVVKIHQAANEEFVKSNELKNYRYIHFATHGFVDSEKPELSGILLAQDTVGGNDGILFSGEIYNLELKADLVVLSACETGLGKIQSGEGIIGLTRALLYAGAKNIIVSLWQVADEATSQLMVEFYNEKLKSENQPTFSEYLRNAKLKMIKEGKFSHPFFWSPFILIGR
jgi:CHAT domain-containing protein